MQKLCTRYKISLDSFLHLQSDSFIFNGRLKTEVENSFAEWLDDVLAQLQYFNG